MIVQSSGSLWNRVIKQYKVGTAIKRYYWPVDRIYGDPQEGTDCNNVTLTDILVTVCAQIGKIGHFREKLATKVFLIGA